jgi:hypothetical protein
MHPRFKVFRIASLEDPNGPCKDKGKKFDVFLNGLDVPHTSDPGPVPSARIVHETKLARTPIYIQRISAVPVQKKFGKIKMHPGHQTVVELEKTMDYDEAMQFIDVQDQVKTGGLHTVKRSRLTYV